MTRSDVFWGADLSCKAVSIGWKSGVYRGVETATWDKKLRGGARLDAAYRSIRSKTLELCERVPSVFVYVEQPSGSFNNLELSYMAGVVQAAIFSGLFEWWDKPVEIRTVTSGTWKKEVLGRGDYKKPGKKDDFEYEGILWCRRQDIEAANDNEADGICIAEYASRVVSFKPTASN